MNNITITGDLGSGKSTVAKALCKLLNFKYLSTGKIQREIGAQKGMNTLELNYFSENNAEIDNLIDDMLIKLNDSEEQYVLDSRMAWFFVKNSFKIYLTVNPLTAAKRVMDDSMRKNEPILNDIQQKANNLIERRTIEDRRFKQKYGVDCANLENYDVVIDTTRAAIEDITNLLLRLYQAWVNKISEPHYWVSPLSLFPTKYYTLVGTEAAKEVRVSIREKGYWDNSAIKIIKDEYFFYILDGHKRVSGAIKNKIPLIPAAISSDPGFADSNANIGFINAWEDGHDFLFDDYPISKAAL